MVSSCDSRFTDSQEKEESGVWNTKIAAEMYGKSERTIRRLLKNGVIEGYKIEGPCGPEWRIKPHARATGGVAHEPTVELFGKVDNDKELFAQLESRIAEIEERMQIQKQHLSSQRLHLVANHSVPMSARSRIATGVSQFWKSLCSVIGAACCLSRAK